MSSLILSYFFCGGNMRKFEKISFKQFAKDVSDGNYNEIELPHRKTKNSAGYDFISFLDEVIAPGEIKKIPTGIKVCMNEDEYLAIYVRSSMGFKYNVRLCNQVGIIDSDYYNNSDNEGHIWVSLQNEGDKDYIIKKGDAFAQGVFTKFLITEEDEASGDRTGGFGSTNRSDENGK